MDAEFHVGLDKKNRHSKYFISVASFNSVRALRVKVSRGRANSAARQQPLLPPPLCRPSLIEMNGGGELPRGV